MRVISIKLHNVFRFGETDNVLDLDELFATSSEDIALITGSIDGDGNDSNGAGKSTVGEALYWSFFERLPRLARNKSKKGTATGEIIRTDDSGKIADGVKKSYVEVTFKTRDGATWRILRGRKVTKSGNHSQLFELYENDKLVGGDKNEKIADILGAGADSVLNSIFFAQMDTGKFLSGTDKDRRDILMDLRGLVVIDKMIKVLRDDHKKEANKTYEELIVRASVIRTRLENDDDAELRKDKLAAAALLDGVDEKVAEKEKAIEDLEKSECKVKSEGIGSRMATLQAELQSVIRERQSALVDIEKSLVDSKKRLSQNKGVLNSSIVKEKADLESRFMEANGIMSSHTQESIKCRQGDIAEAKEKLSYVKSDLSTVSSGIEEAIKLASEADFKVRSLQEELSSLHVLSDSIECPTCGNVLPEDVMAKKLDVVNSAIESAVSIQSVKRGELSSLRSKEGDLKTCLSKQENILQDESLLAADVEKIKSAKVTISECRQRAGEIKANEERLEQDITSLELKIKEDAGKVTERAAQYDDRKMKMQQLVDDCQKEMNAVMEEVNVVNEQISSLRSGVADLHNSKSEVAAKIGRIDEKLDARKKDANQMADIKSRIKEEKRLIDRIEYLEKKLANDIKNDVAKSCVPLLNFYSNEFLSILRDGTRVDFGFDGKNITIRLIGSTATTYNMLSGGEQSALRLAVSMALSMISIGSAADLPDMIFLDEIFGAFDTKTCDNVFRLLKRLNRNFERIIVITHDELIKERFKTRVHVDKKDGISHISY